MGSSKSSLWELTPSFHHPFLLAVEAPGRGLHFFGQHCMQNWRLLLWEWPGVEGWNNERLFICSPYGNWWGCIGFGSDQKKHILWQLRYHDVGKRTWM